MSRKFALLIGNSEYEDKNLTKLLKPSADVDALGSVLKDAKLGGFDEVTPLINESTDTVRRTIARFFLGRDKDDLLLLYFACHGVRDDKGKLYLAAGDTERDLLRATAIPAAFVTEEMDDSRSQRQVLILDCCFGGAFAHGTRGVSKASVGTETAFAGDGYGRAVLTATDKNQYAWEGDKIIGEVENSVFTHYLVQGIQTGEADSDADGEITVDELYDYVYSKVVSETEGKQTPEKWTYKGQGNVTIARNLVVKPIELSDYLRSAIESRFATTRGEAVSELQRLLNSGNRGLAITAHEALIRMTKEDDSLRIRARANDILSAYNEAQDTKEEKAVVEPEPDATSTGPEKEQAKTKVGEDGAEMALIPAGEFQMGSDDGDDDEKPAHTVYLDAFYIDKYEVTNALYKKFMDATGHKAPRYWDNSEYNATDQPVVGVTWADAAAYAEWTGKHLPTEAQWEKAARGGLVGMKYPWGDEITEENANYGKNIGNTTPIGKYPPSDYDLYDMAGNVWEWCADWYGEDYYANSVDRNPPGPDSGTVRVLRGGSWLDAPSYLRVSYRRGDAPTRTFYPIGFRCVSQDSNVTP